jgi:murein L,D-transpeptidase YafK
MLEVRHLYRSRGHSRRRQQIDPDDDALALRRGARDLRGRAWLRTLGPQVQEGDGRTPEGDYIVDRRNPNSEFYLSIGIDYPNEADIAAAEEADVDPGGDIFIHGTPRPFARVDDWTAGCIAVTNREMRQIYAMVRDGTPISIQP